jgi:hypothetical protein
MLNDVLGFYFIFSSNLTFSLAPGWSFLESEDWRKDCKGFDRGVVVMLAREFLQFLRDAFY